MAIAGIKLGDFVGGLAKSLDERLQDDMRRTADRSDRVRDYHVTRATRKQERFEEDQRQLEETLRGLAGLIKDSGIELPEGMTKADFAAQLYSGAGGDLTSGKELLSSLKTHREKAGSISGLINKANLVTQGKGFGDYINNFVRRPESMIKVPEGLKGGTGFLKDVDITKGIKAEMDTMFKTDPQADRFEVKGLGIDRTKMVAAQEFAKEQKLYDIKFKNALLGNRKLEAEIGQLGAIDYNVFKSNYTDSLKQGLNQIGVDVDVNGKFNVKRGSQKYIETKRLFKDILKSSTNMLSNTQSLNKENKYLLATIGGNLIQYDYIPEVGGKPDQIYDVGTIYKVNIDGEDQLRLATSSKDITSGVQIFRPQKK